jgi:hypothetical protein
MYYYCVLIINFLVPKLGLVVVLNHKYYVSTKNSSEFQFEKLRGCCLEK